MIRTLLIITGASLVLCIAALAGAAAIGGQDMARHGWTWSVFDESGDGVRFERANRDLGPEVTRNLPWDAGGVLLAVDVPGEVTYVQGPESGVTVTGPQELVDRLRIANGNRLTFEDDDRSERVTIQWGPGGVSGWSGGDRLRIRVTSPSVKIFELSGSARLSIRNYDQPHLLMTMSGSGEVDAQGRTETVKLAITGSGEADLSGLETTDADVDISGSGDATVGPTGVASIEISGSGNVDLTRRPASLTQSISGSGEVNQ